MVVTEFQKYKSDFLKCMNRFLEFESLYTVEFISPNNSVIL